MNTEHSRAGTGPVGTPGEASPGRAPGRTANEEPEQRAATDIQPTPRGSGVDDARDRWDARYAEAAQMWSGQANTAVTVELVRTRPGRALDVGCGEGADAIWLAAHGWQVTGLDPSAVALGRAYAAAARAGVLVSWLQGTLADANLAVGGYDLVLCCYPALPLDGAPMARLTSLVATGGDLMVVHHAHVDEEVARAHGFDLASLLQAGQVRDVIEGNPDWDVLTDELRPREARQGAGAEHRDDLVFRARRRG